MRQAFMVSGWRLTRNSAGRLRCVGGKPPGGRGVKRRLGRRAETAAAPEFDSVTAASASRKVASSSSCGTMAIGACIEASRPFGVSMESRMSMLSRGSGVSRGAGGACVGICRGLSSTRRGASSTVRDGVGEAR